jgi:hypothetical protein
MVIDEYRCYADGSLVCGRKDVGWSGVGRIDVGGLNKCVFGGVGDRWVDC